MSQRTPITVRNLYRSILGRVAGYRGNRVIAVQGTVVGLPEAPLNEHGFRNLLYKARGLGDDGKPALNVYLSVGTSTSAFTPKESTLSTQRYLNSTFVNVQKEDGTIETCLNLIYAGGVLPTNDCPQVDDGEYNLNDPGNVMLAVTMNDATEIESIIVGDYLLTEGQHYTFIDGYLYIANIEYLYNAFSGAVHGDTVEFIIQFDICDPITAVITAIDESEDDVS